jgi:putative methionine-R-sulfoxide reductase with GAF domain
MTTGIATLARTRANNIVIINSYICKMSRYGHQKRKNKHLYVYKGLFIAVVGQEITMVFQQAQRRRWLGFYISNSMENTLLLLSISPVPD